MQYLKIGVVLLIIFFILIFNVFSFEVKNFFYLVSEPIQKKLWSAGATLSNFSSSIFNSQNLKKENEELKKNIQALIVENEFLKELKKENDFLRNALNLGLEKEFNLEVAEIIGKDIAQDYLIIDKGSADGLKGGLVVISQEKVLVGRIEKSYENFSKVQLLTFKNSSFDIEISEGIFGLAKGNGNFNLLIDLLPKEKEIKTGDKIFTSALAGSFPKGLLVGEVQKVQKLDIESFQKAEVKIAFDVGATNFVFIIKGLKKW